MKNIIGKRWRDAASLIVLTKRNNEVLSRVQEHGSVNYDILLQTRTQTASFPNSVVFPGGVSDPIDSSQRWLTLLSTFGYSKQDFESFHHPSNVVTPIFQKDPVLRHIELRITAIRETFEELGLLLCSRKHKEERLGQWADVIEDIDVAYWQKRVYKNPEDWLELCKEYKCYPDICSLNYWSNWLTPPKFEKRFNTVFFVAAVEKKPKGIKSSSEVVNVEWLDPQAVLSSEKILYPPQIYELNRLSYVKDITELIKFANERSGYHTDLLSPVIVKAKDGSIHLLPGDDLYPASIDYNDNTTLIHLDKTILELRENCHTLHRFESTKKAQLFIIKNFKPAHHLNMGDVTISLGDM